MTFWIEFEDIGIVLDVWAFGFVLASYALIPSLRPLVVVL